MSTNFKLLYKLPEAKDCDPSPLASETLVFSQKAFFAALLFAPPIVDDGSCKYIPLGTRKNMFSTDSIIIRPCYDHLLPQIHNRILREEGYVTAVTGTPGIGKSVFGVLLVRHYVQQKKTVLYWEDDNIYMFSFDSEAKRFFGLNDFAELDGKVCCAGYWDTAKTRHWPDFFNAPSEFDIVVIHDPKMGDTRVALRETHIKRLIYILSHGHSLISFWATKGGGPFRYEFLPLWSKPETVRSLPQLKRQDSTASPLDVNEVDELYNRFGGCIRGWLAQGAVWSELSTKIEEVAKNHGDNVLAKHTSSRGSIIHMAVDFDEERPIAACKESDEMSVDQPGGGDEVQGEYNDFRNYQYIFGSFVILETFEQALLNESNEALKLCLKNWACQNGFECIYGALFELRCHRLLENNTGNLVLKMRVVHRNDSDNTDETYDVLFPVCSGTVRYKSNDPSILKEQAYDGMIEKNKYLWPYSSNHPSYDSAVVVDGMAFSLPVNSAALLLQMTVSGATGLPRRPEHAVKQHIRTMFDGVFKARIPGYKESGAAYTAFMVPTECFEKFVFQKETIMDSDDVETKAQPDFQLVFEVRDLFTYRRASPKTEPPPSDFFSRKRYHRYSDAIRSPKQIKLQLPLEKK